MTAGCEATEGRLLRETFRIASGFARNPRHKSHLLRGRVGEPRNVKRAFARIHEVVSSSVCCLVLCTS